MGNTISFKREFGFILVGAIIFIASLMWKDILVEIEEFYFPKTKGLFNRLLYTIIITVILLIIAVHLKSILGLNRSLPTDINLLRTINIDSDSNDNGNDNGNDHAAIQ